MTPMSVSPANETMYIRVRVQPGSKKERVAKIGEREFEMTVKEPAERNLANKRVRVLLAEACEKPLGDVRLVSGHRSQTKMFHIEM